MFFFIQPNKSADLVSEFDALGVLWLLYYVFGWLFEFYRSV